jgi:hypothetical protein
VTTRTRTAGLCAAALTLLSAGAATAFSDAVVLFTFQDERITESSGLVASSVSDDWFFTHNDSGDEARFYVVDRSGRTLATHTMPGVDSNDWEDMARGPDEQGRSSLFLGDIGDNFMMREEVVVYRVPEPTVEPTRTGLEVETPAPAAFVLRYEDAPHDAETLLVHPVTGQLFVVTKTYVGQASVYAAPVPLRTDGVNDLTRVADLVFTTTGTPGGAQFGPGANLATTGGDIAPAGDRLVIRTYTDLYEWALPDDDVAAALQPTRPRERTPLPDTVQGEAAAYTRDGFSVLVSTEGKGAPVHLLAGAAPPAQAPAPAGPPPVGPPLEQPAPQQPAPPAPVGPAAAQAGTSQSRLPATGGPGGAGLLALALVAGAAFFRRAASVPRHR